MAKKLYLEFSEDKGINSHTVAIPSPKEDLTKADIDAAVKGLLETTIFAIDGHILDGLTSAKYKENVTQTIE